MLNLDIQTDGPRSIIKDSVVTYKVMKVGTVQGKDYFWSPLTLPTHRPNKPTDVARGSVHQSHTDSTST